MEQAVVNGIDLDYQVAGRGDPVLLIGTGPIADSFVPLLRDPSLLERCLLVTYRQRRSVPPSAGAPAVSFSDHAADAAALLRQLDLPRAHVAGHSTGAAIALQLAVDAPDIVHSLILFEPPLLAAASAGAFFEKVMPAVNAYQSGDRDGAMAMFLSVVCSLDWPACKQVIEEQVPGGVERALKEADNFFEGYLPALNGWEFGPELADAISQPTLSLLGTRSEQLFVDSNALLRRWLPQIETCAIEGAGHLLHIESPEEVVRCVGQFVARHPMRRG